MQAAVQGKYAKLTHVTKPLGCENTEDSNTTYGAWACWSGRRPAPHPASRFLIYQI